MKKFLSLLLAIAAAACLTVPAFAANPKITKQIAAIDGVDAGDIGPGYQIWIPLVKDAFEGATEDLTMSDVKTGKITVKQSVRSGSKAIASVEIKEYSKKAHILVKLAEPYTSTKPLDFETTLTLYIDGKKQSFSTVVTGSLRNEETVVYADTDYVDLSDGQTAICEETAKSVEAYLGNDLSIFIRMSKGKEYYGAVSLEPTADDDEILSKYPDIEEVYTLTTIGLNASGNIVKIDVDDTYYAYGKDLEYLGKTSELLPYSTKYYLSAKKLDIVDDSDDTNEPDDLDEPVETEEPSEPSESSEILNAIAPGTGENTSGGNKGSNPDTGTSGMEGFAAIAGIISLAGMAIFGKRI